MVNKVILLGRVGAPAQMRIFEGGIRKAWFPLATHEKYRTSEGIKERTTWHTVVCWGGLADYVYERLQKGDLVYVEGRLSSYKLGEQRFYEIIAQTLRLLSRSSAQKSSETKTSEPEDLPLDMPMDMSVDMPEEEIPF